MPVCYKNTRKRAWFLISLSLISGVLSSSGEDLEELINELAKQNDIEKELEKFAQAVADDDSENVGFQQRSLIVSETQNIFKLENYGCWCYADEDTLTSKGAGEPQDAFDELCKSLHQNYECLRMDVETETGETCIPELTKYTIIQLNIRKSADEICMEARANMNECQFNTCLIELTYVLAVFKLYMSKTYPSPSFRHSTSEFEFDETCLAFSEDFWAFYENYAGEDTGSLHGDDMNEFLHISDDMADSPETADYEPLPKEAPEPAHVGSPDSTEKSNVEPQHQASTAAAASPPQQAPGPPQLAPAQMAPGPPLMAPGRALGGARPSPVSNPFEPSRKNENNNSYQPNRGSKPVQANPSAPASKFTPAAAQTASQPSLEKPKQHGQPVQAQVPTIAVVQAPIFQRPTKKPSPIHWPEKMCCGEFPHRKPFKPQNGKKRCCLNDGKTYDHATMQCCANGIRAYGGIC